MSCRARFTHARCELKSVTGYSFQHSYYGKLLIFPGSLSWVPLPILVNSKHPSSGPCFVDARTTPLMRSQCFVPPGVMCGYLRFALWLGLNSTYKPFYSGLKKWVIVQMLLCRLYPFQMHSQCPAVWLPLALHPNNASLLLHPSCKAYLSMVALICKGLCNSRRLLPGAWSFVMRWLLSVELHCQESKWNIMAPVRCLDLERHGILVSYVTKVMLKPISEVGLAGCRHSLCASFKPVLQGRASSVSSLSPKAATAHPII